MYVEQYDSDTFKLQRNMAELMKDIDGHVKGYVAIRKYRKHGAIESTERTSVT